MFPPLTRNLETCDQPRIRTHAAGGVRALSAALISASGAIVLLRCFPALELNFFAQAAARLASLLLGTPVLREDEGWFLPVADLPVLVTTACSATDFFVTVGALVAWQCVRRGQQLWRAALVGLISAAPLAIGVNALRVVAVSHAHRLIIPAFPESHHAALHMLTGVAIFLPSLIAITLLLEFNGRFTRPAISRN